MSNNPPSADRRIQRLTMMAVAGALVLAGGAFYPPEQMRIWSNLLVGTYFLLTIGLGGAVFVALTYVSGAGWSVAFRRVPEAMAKIVPLAGAALLLTVVLRIQDYGWRLHGDADAGTFWFKEVWLTRWFWLVRGILYVVLWSWLAGWLVARSRRQDAAADSALNAGNVRLSALFLAVYAITFSLASVDWIMALEPMWFSTMWGVYHFAGMIQAALAVVIILGLRMSAPGEPLQGIFSRDHLHDLGKLLLGFSCFWMYIWFCQYMLIWYSNIPEETSYFIARTRSPWGPIVVLTLVLNWGVPFFLLLPRPAKRSATVMMRIAVVVLIGRWVDLYQMVFPATVGEAPVFGLWEVAGICCLIGAAGALWHRSFAKAPPVPRHDPYLAESLHYHA